MNSYLPRAATALFLILGTAGPLLAQQGLAIGTGGVAALWAANCQRCHGERGQGGGAGTRSLLDDEWLEGRTAGLMGTPFDGPGSDRALFTSTKQGHPDSGMEAFGETLTDAQIWALTVYIHELREIDRRKRDHGPTAKSGVYAAREHSFTIETVIGEGVSVPWSVDFIPAGAAREGGPPAGAMLVAERSGKLRLWHGGALSAPVSGTPSVRDRGQGGLMDVAPHPDYAKNGWIYLSFTDPLEQGGRTLGMTKIVRGRIKNNAWTEQETIFEAKPEHYLRTDLHFGCRIVFTAPASDGRRHVYFPIGERGMQDHAQELARPNGKIHRLWDDGQVPDDNPFLATANAYPSIWSYGHRNPQGLALDLDENLWDTEHGPRGGDEVNLVRKGGNYGWPLVSFGINYTGAPFATPWPDTARVTQPIEMPAFIWLPSIGACGLDVARGPMFAKWRGDLLAGGLSGMNVDRLRVREGKVVEREELVFRKGRVRDVVCGPDGSVYIVLNDPDSVIRLVEKP